jgi:CHAT domain-containing protein/tetratricopeptide (TPR) repeat protein
MKFWIKLCGLCVLAALPLGQVAGQSPEASGTGTQSGSQMPAAAEQSSKKQSPQSSSSEHLNATDDLASALLRAASDEERNTLLQQQKDLVTKNLVSALTRQGARLSAKGDYPKAIAVFTFTQSLAAQIGDSEGSGHAYLDLGVTYRRQSDYPKALECFQKVMETARASGNQRLLAQALTDRGIVLFHLGEYPAALESYQQSLQLSEAAHEDQSVEHAQVNIGNVLRVQGNYSQAEQYYRKAQAFEEKQTNDPRELARILNNLGNLGLVQSDYSGALHDYLQAQRLLEKGGDPEVLASVLNNIGAALAAQGNYGEALDDHRRSLELATKAGDKHAMCVSLHKMSDVEQEQGNYAVALEDAEKSATLADELGEKKLITEILNTLGEIQVDRGDLNAALETHLKALSMAEALGYEETMAQASSGVSRDYARLGKVDQAIEFAQRASALAEKLGDRLALFDAHLNAGRAFRASGKVAEARREFDQSIDSVESLRSDLSGSEETRQRFFDSKIAPYQEMAEMLVSERQFGEALTYAERAKGRALLDVLRGGKIQITKAMTDAERNQEQQLEEKLISLNSQIQQERLDGKPDRQHLSDLMARLKDVRGEYDQFQVNLYLAHPELKAKRGEIQAVTLNDAAGFLSDVHSACLEFLVTEKNVYLFVISQNGTRDAGSPELEVYSIAVKPDDLARKAEEFREKLARRDLTARASGRELYDLLLKPAARQLASKNALTIVPDGVLWDLPFQALREGNHYLLERYAISYAPSLTVLREMKKLHQKNREEQAFPRASTLLAMADPVLGNDSLPRAAIVYRGEQLGPLPETRHEVRALKMLYGSRESQVYTGNDAREDRFKSEAGSFRILHLATHGILDNASPMYSNVLLASGDTGKEDGLLEAREIMQMDLKADLAVLSACETARGRISAGEGVIGLAWAFFVAGTSTTVVSQWKVESTSTAELMLAFHRARQSRQPGASPFRTARALQRAELKLLHDPRFSDPVYWAGFIVVGDPQ